MFNKRRRIKDLEERMEALWHRVSYFTTELHQLREGLIIPSDLDKNVTTNIYFDEGLSNGGVISQDEYEDRKYNMDINDVTFHELAQYVLAGTPIHRDRKTIVANPSGNTQFHKSNILCNESEASDGLSDKSSEK